MSRLSRSTCSGFSIGGMVAQQIVVDRPETAVRKLILIGTPRATMTQAMVKATLPRKTAAIFGAAL